MAALIAVGLLLTRLPGHGHQRISEERAVAIARPHIDFTPKGHNIRLVRRGIPPRAFWAVSFWIRNATGQLTRVTVVVVDATSGRVTEVRKAT
jgi:hypothetical protein